MTGSESRDAVQSFMKEIVAELSRLFTNGVETPFKFSSGARIRSRVVLVS